MSQKRDMGFHSPDVGHLRPGLNCWHGADRKCSSDCLDFARALACAHVSAVVTVGKSASQGPSSWDSRLANCGRPGIIDRSRCVLISSSPFVDFCRFLAAIRQSSCRGPRYCALLVDHCWVYLERRRVRQGAICCCCLFGRYGIVVDDLVLHGRHLNGPVNNPSSGQDSYSRWIRRLGQNQIWCKGGSVAGNQGWNPHFHDPTGCPA